jgi:hypothetical protein
MLLLQSEQEGRPWMIASGPPVLRRHLTNRRRPQSSRPLSGGNDCHNRLAKLTLAECRREAYRSLRPRVKKGGLAQKKLRWMQRYKKVKLQVQLRHVQNIHDIRFNLLLTIDTL